MQPPWTAPAVSAAIAAAGCLGVLLADPHDGGWPLCPFSTATGLACPACGSLRATNLLMRGDVAGAAGANLLWVLAIPWLLALWGTWTARRFTRRGGPPRLVPSRRVGWALLALALTYGVVRNLPFAATALAP